MPPLPRGRLISVVKVGMMLPRGILISLFTVDRLARPATTPVCICIIMLARKGHPVTAFIPHHFLARRVIIRIVPALHGPEAATLWTFLPALREPPVLPRCSPLLAERPGSRLPLTARALTTLLVQFGHFHPLVKLPRLHAAMHSLT